MPKYRKKPVVVHAEQWAKLGDHPQVVAYSKHHCSMGKEWVPDRRCPECGHAMGVHGWVETLEGGHVVCPGDWIIEGVQGELYPCKPGIFEATYEPAE